MSGLSRKITRSLISKGKRRRGNSKLALLNSAERDRVRKMGGNSYNELHATKGYRVTKI